MPFHNNNSYIPDYKSFFMALIFDSTFLEFVIILVLSFFIFLMFLIILYIVYMLYAIRRNFYNRLEEVKNNLLKIRESLKWVINNNFFFENFKKEILGGKEDVTAIISWMNIGTDRLENCFKSLRNQDYNKGLINLLLVDYGSNQNVEKVKKLCKKYNVKYVRVENVLYWNRAHCINVGLKNTKTKYVLITDIDIVFEKSYISECIKDLQMNPFQLLYSDMLECPKGIDVSDMLKDFYKIKIRSYKKDDDIVLHGASICFSLTKFFYLINGYDEFYRLWGYEDLDLLDRFEQIGIKLVNISNKTSSLHQWHPKHDGVKSIPEFFKIVDRNEKYYKNSYKILRNKDGWGKI